MKIDKHILGPQIQQKTNNGKAGSVAGNNFQNILENRLRESTPVVGTDPLTRIPETSSAPVSVRLEGLALTDSTLDTLESFGRALGDTTINTRDLEPFVSALEGETSGLLAVKGKLPEGDPLGLLLDRVAVAGYVEAAKYRRGDYGA